MERIKVLHLEDYKIMRDGIEALLERNDKVIENMGNAKNTEELFLKLSGTPIDVLVMDLFLDATEGPSAVNALEVCERVQLEFPKVKIVAHSIYDDADRIARILRAGASGFVSKKSGFDDLIEAIKAVYTGRSYVCTETRGRLKNLNSFLSGLENRLRGKDDLFSFREREVLQLMSEGLSSKQIAGSLSITERTVETHRKNMIDKAGVKNSIELIAYAAELRLTKK